MYFSKMTQQNRWSRRRPQQWPRHLIHQIPLVAAFRLTLHNVNITTQHSGSTLHCYCISPCATLPQRSYVIGTQMWQYCICWILQTKTNNANHQTNDFFSTAIDKWLVDFFSNFEEQLIKTASAWWGEKLLVSFGLYEYMGLNFYNL